MKTAVIFKWCKDPSDARVSDQGEVSWPNVKNSPTDDDPAAMVVAKGISSPDDIVGVTIGDGKPEWAAARDAASTIIVEDVVAASDGTVAADAIAAGVKHAGAEVAVIGDSDWDYGTVVAAVGKIGWKSYAGVVDAHTDGDAIMLTIKTPGGNKIVSTHAPVTICAKALGQEQAVPGMKQTLAARKKPVEKLNSNELGAFSDMLSVSEGTHLPSGKSCVVIDGSDANAAAVQLLDALRSDGIL